MKCAYPEERIALYLEGDLPARPARETTRHLLGCRRCQNVAAELRAGLDALKTLAQPPFEIEDERDWRQRVSGGLRAIEDAPGAALRLERAVFWGPRGRQALAAATVVAAIAVLLFAAPRRFHDAAPLVPTNVAAIVLPDKVAITPMPIAPAEPDPAERFIPAVTTSESRLAPPEPPAPLIADEISSDPEPPLLVKLLTDDPNVVIYWLVEPSAGER